MINIMKPAPFIKTWHSTRLMMLSLVGVLYLLMIPYLLLRAESSLVISYMTLAGVTLAFELLMNLFTRELTITDGSALLSATLLFFLLPKEISLSMMIQLAFFMIVIAKWALGGMGYSYVNPVILAFFYFIISTASRFEDNLFLQLSLLFGSQIVLVALFIIFIVLAFTRIIDWGVSVSFAIGYVVSMALVFYFRNDIDSLWSYLIYSPLWVFVAIFIATSYATLPSSGRGKAIYGFCMSILMVLFTFHNRFEDLAMPLAVLIVNVLSPIINYYTLGKTFAGNVKKRW